MNRTHIAAFAIATFISGGLNLAGLGLAAGTAEADPFCSPSNANTAPCAPPGTCDTFGTCGQLWYPGSGMSGIPDWDKNVCHTFYFDSNAPLI